MTGRKTLDQLTSDELDALHDRLDRAEIFVTTVADIIADHEGDEWGQHPATTAIRRGFGTVPHGWLLARWPDGDVTVMSPRAAAKRLTADDQHVYLSTGCWHGDHDYCQSMTGLNGAKRPGECKFCSAPCQCPCHHDEAKVQPGPA